MSKLVQIQYDMNCTDSICMIQIVKVRLFWEGPKNLIWRLLSKCQIKWVITPNFYALLRKAELYNSYDSQTCLNLFWFNMIQIVMIHMILKHVWTCSESLWYELIQFLNMSGLEIKTWWNTLKIWANGRKNLWQQSHSLDRCEQVERSKST